MKPSGDGHAPGGREETSGWVVELSASKNLGSNQAAACNENFAVGQRRTRMEPEGRGKVTSVAEAVDSERLRDGGGAASAGEQRVAELAPIDRQVAEKCIAITVGDCG